jgi:hypothetical protein
MPSMMTLEGARQIFGPGLLVELVRDGYLTPERLDGNTWFRKDRVEVLSDLFQGVMKQMEKREKALHKGRDRDNLIRQVEDLWSDIPWSVMENNAALDKLQRLTDNADSPEALESIRRECARLSSTLATSDAGEEEDRREAVQVLRRMSQLASRALTSKGYSSQAQMEGNRSDEVPGVPGGILQVERVEDPEEEDLEEEDGGADGGEVAEFEEEFDEEGNPIRYLDPATEKEWLDLQRFAFSRTGMTMDQLREWARGK